MTNKSGVFEYLFVFLGVLLLYTFLAPLIFTGENFWLSAAIWHGVLLSFWYVLHCVFRIYDKTMLPLRGGLGTSVLLIAFGAAATLIILAVILSLGSRILGLGTDLSPQYASIHWYTPLVVVLAGYSEEIIFREYSISRLLRLSVPPWLAISISALIFALIHSPEAYLQSFLAGTVLGYAWHKTYSIHCCAIAHIIYNVVLLLLI